MTGTVIALIVIGLIFIFASFFISEAVSDSVKEDGAVEHAQITLSDEQKEKLRQDAAQELASSYENAVYQFDEQLSVISNEKTLALGDYAVSVCDEIEKNHKEAMFLYSMLGDKEKELKLLVEQVDTLKVEMQQALSESKQLVTEVMQAQGSTDDDALFQETMESMDELDTNHNSTDVDDEGSDIDNANEIILELKKSGMSIIEIAKQLGLGVGEV